MIGVWAMLRAMHRERRLEAMSQVLYNEIPAPGDVWNRRQVADRMAVLVLRQADRSRRLDPFTVANGLRRDS